jgi:hypothetical protein
MFSLDQTSIYHVLSRSNKYTSRLISITQVYTTSSLDHTSIYYVLSRSNKYILRPLSITQVYIMFSLDHTSIHHVLSSILSRNAILNRMTCREGRYAVTPVYLSNATHPPRSNWLAIYYYILFEKVYTASSSIELACDILLYTFSKSIYRVLLDRTGLRYTHHHIDTLAQR